MQPFSRIVGLLLLAAMVASSAGAQAVMVPAAHTAHPAGCHGHALPVPAPPPRNHQCCIAGHNHAVPANLFSGLAPLPYFGPAGDVAQAMPAYRGSGKPSILIPFSIGSPGSLSLRI